MIHAFIINQHAGIGGFAAEIREHLSRRKDIEYYIFHTRREGGESDVAREIMNLFEGEKVRIYCCGGSGTLTNALNGVDDLSKVEIAFYPKGLTNDFLKVFGEDENKFTELDAMIDGECAQIDYIETSDGISLNTFSVGIDSSFGKKMRDVEALNVFGNMVPYLVSFIYAAFVAKTEEYEVEVDGEKYTGKFSEVFFGNGGTIGGALCFEDKPDITDGLGKTVIFKGLPSFRILRLFINLAKKRLDKCEGKEFDGFGKSISIKRCDNKAFVMNYDGEFRSVKKSFTARIVPKGLNFVLPKGVELK
ncbi:MAG: hypothetical protein MJ133_04665 [Lachnospiraceae bacterium]|nr:hypothetical protein [Lachnospiraceae bacterium]